MSAKSWLAYLLLPLAYSRLDRPLSHTVWAMDAAPHGYGICKSRWHGRSVNEVAAWDERWRYHYGAATARSNAMDVGIASSWAEVPRRLLNSKKWGVVFS